MIQFQNIKRNCILTYSLNFLRRIINRCNIHNYNNNIYPSSSDSKNLYYKINITFTNSTAFKILSNTGDNNLLQKHLAQIRDKQTVMNKYFICVSNHRSILRANFGLTELIYERIWGTYISGR